MGENSGVTGMGLMKEGGKRNLCLCGAMPHVYTGIRGRKKEEVRVREMRI